MAWCSNHSIYVYRHNSFIYISAWYKYMSAILNRTNNIYSRTPVCVSGLYLSAFPLSPLFTCYYCNMHLPACSYLPYLCFSLLFLFCCMPAVLHSRSLSLFLSSRLLHPQHFLTGKAQAPFCLSARASPAWPPLLHSHCCHASFPILCLSTAHCSSAYFSLFYTLPQVTAAAAPERNAAAPVGAARDC